MFPKSLFCSGSAQWLKEKETRQLLQQLIYQVLFVTAGGLLLPALTIDAWEWVTIQHRDGIVAAHVEIRKPLRFFFFF